MDYPQAPSAELHQRRDYFDRAANSERDFTESFLSFLGLGVNAPMPSLGSLASDALNGIYSYTYRLIIPAVVICLIVLSLNLFGDGLRDAFDPKLNA